MTDLSDAPVDTPVEDPFAEARRDFPAHTLIRLLYPPLGVEFIVKLAPGSRYHGLIATEQTVEVQFTTPLKLVQ